MASNPDVILEIQESHLRGEKPLELGSSGILSFVIIAVISQSY